MWIVQVKARAVRKAACGCAAVSRNWSNRQLCCTSMLTSDLLFLDSTAVKSLMLSNQFYIDLHGGHRMLHRMVADMSMSHDRHLRQAHIDATLSRIQIISS